MRKGRTISAIALIVVLVGTALGTFLVVSGDHAQLFRDLALLFSSPRMAIENLIDFAAKQPKTILDSVLASLTSAIAAAFVIWFFSRLARWIGHKLRRRRRGLGKAGEAFPFECIGAQNVLGSLSSYPQFEPPYVPPEDPALAQRTAALANVTRVLIVGRMGVGKTREAAELISRLDVPSGQVFVLMPKTTFLSTGFRWPADIPFHQHRIVLLLENLNEFEAHDEVADEVYRIKGGAVGFEKALSGLIELLAERCDELRVIATLRVESAEWKVIERRSDEPLWKSFHVHRISPHTRAEALEYIEGFAAQVHSITLDGNAADSIASRFDGTFASIRDYLRLKISPSGPAETVTELTGSGVRDFIGKYPDDWEVRVYQGLISRDAEGRAILEALAVLAQAHIVPYEYLVMDLAGRLLDKGIPWLRRRRCRAAYRRLDIAEWIPLRDGILRAPEPYLEGRTELGSRLDQLAAALLAVSNEQTAVPGLDASLLMAARVARNQFGRLDLCLRLTRRSVELRPDEPRSWLALGGVYSRLGRDAEALQARQKAVSLWPESGLVWSALALSLISLEEFDAAHEAIEHAQSIEGTTASVLGARATLALKQKKSELAIELYGEAARIAPNLTAPWIGLGRSFLKANMPRRAFRCFHKALRLGSRSDPFTWISLGISLKKLRRHGTSEACFRRAISLDANSLVAWSRLAEVLLAEEKLEESIEAYHIALKLAPKSAISWSGLGEALNKAGRFQEAIAAHKMAMALGNDGAATRFGLAVAYYHRGRWAEAAPLFLAGRLHEEGNLTRMYLVDIQRRLAEAGNTQLASRINAALHQSFAGAKLLQAIKFAEAGYRDGAIAVCDRLCDQDPDNYNVWQGVCAVQRRLGDYDRAIAAGQRAITLMPNEASPWYALGRAYEDAKQFQLAEAALTEVLRLKPSHAKAKRALARVRDVGCTAPSA